MYIKRIYTSLVNILKGFVINHGDPAHENGDYFPTCVIVTLSFFDSLYSSFSMLLLLI